MIDQVAARRAVANVASRGDTDVFPFPFENYMFYDRIDEVADLIVQMGRDVTAARTTHPIENYSTLANVSYGGFRWVTQIDPVWNAFFLGSVLKFAPEFEAARLPPSDQTVFSYRYDSTGPSDQLFGDSAWASFQAATREKAMTAQYVVAVDIADFYSRVYHHRIENAMLSAGMDEASARQVISLLSSLSAGTSYGLPVGGPAARILSELALNRTDRLINSASGIGTFARYADDYRFFANDLSTAHRSVGFAAEILLRNEGLSLQKSKTRIMSADEYLETLDPLNPPAGTTGDFMRLHIHFDPYSTTAEADYEEIKSQLNRFDILGLLGAELRKGQIHTSLTKRLLSAISLLDSDLREQALLSLSESFSTLSPVMPQVLMALRKGLIGLDDDFAAKIHARVRALVDNGSYIANVDLNVNYIVRLLSDRRTAENEKILTRLFTASHGFTGRRSPCIRRDIVVAMANWRNLPWLSNLKNDALTEEPWVRRAFIATTPLLLEEGRHWYRNISRFLAPIDRLVHEWVLAKHGSDANWTIPS